MPHPGPRTVPRAQKVLIELFCELTRERGKEGKEGTSQAPQALLYNDIILEGISERLALVLIEGREDTGSKCGVSGPPDRMPYIKLCWGPLAKQEPHCDQPGLHCLCAVAPVGVMASSQVLARGQLGSVPGTAVPVPGNRSLCSAMLQLLLCRGETSHQETPGS